MDESGLYRGFKVKALNKDCRRERGNKMKKFTSTVIASAVVALLLTGCGGGQGAAGGSASGTAGSSPAALASSAAAGGAATDKKVVTITRRLAEWGARDDNFKQAVARVNEELAGKNVEVVMEEWPKVGDDELLLQSQAGKNADLFINSSVDIGWQQEAGIIRDIDWVKDLITLVQYKLLPLLKIVYIYRRFEGCIYLSNEYNHFLG